MFQRYSELTLTGVAYRSDSEQSSSSSVSAEPSEQWPERDRVQHVDFISALPLRYSALSVRRKLIRMMLTLHKYGEAGGNLSSCKLNSFTPAADYARATIDPAMLRGELRCGSSEEMSHYFLSLSMELLTLMTSIRQNKTSLRKEIRCKTADFLDRFAADATV